MPVIAKKSTCTQCGYPITLETVAAQLIVCPACSSSLLFDNGQMKDVGKVAVIAKEPALFSLHQWFRHRDWAFMPVGRVRYGYGDGDGFWDEWYVVSENDAVNWVSVDEGDVAVEAPVKPNSTIPPFDALQIGQTLRIANQTLKVMEKNFGTFLGAEGQLPFRPDLRPRFEYVDLLGPKGASFTIEYSDKGAECFKGSWIDPFEITGRETT